MNRPGVLNRITQSVLRYGYNIETMTLTGTDDPDVSIITIGLNFVDLDAAELLTKQLGKQVDVFYAADITNGPNY